MTFLARFGVLLVLVMAPAAALALPPVWTVRDHDSTLVIFGSVHLLPDGVPAQLRARGYEVDGPR